MQEFETWNPGDLIFFPQQLPYFNSITISEGLQSKININMPRSISCYNIRWSELTMTVKFHMLVIVKFVYDWPLPVNFSSVERLCVECDGGSVARLGTSYIDFTSQLHPGNCEYRTSIGTRKSKYVFFSIFHQLEYPWVREKCTQRSRLLDVKYPSIKSTAAIMKSKKSII